MFGWCLLKDPAAESEEGPFPPIFIEPKEENAKFPTPRKLWGVFLLLLAAFEKLLVNALLLLLLCELFVNWLFYPREGVGDRDPIWLVFIVLLLWCYYCLGSEVRLVISKLLPGMLLLFPEK